MPFLPAAYLDGLTSGHLDWPPTVGAVPVPPPTVFVNGRPVVVTGSTYITHVNSKGIPHPFPTAIGTSNVTAYGMPMCRIGDFLSCGDMLANGSKDVLLGP